jgi:hypothetical protein
MLERICCSICSPWYIRDSRISRIRLADIEPSISQLENVMAEVTYHLSSLPPSSSSIPSGHTPFLIQGRVSFTLGKESKLATI